VDIASPSRARREFYAKVIGKDEAQVKARWSKLVFTGKGSAPKELPSGADVVKAVAADPHAIGYVDSSFVNITVKIILTVK
jgi:ABC-type phosphate transport system substrate-binding protein